MAHPSRAAAAERTCAALGELDARILWDPEPGERPSPWRTFARICAVAPRDRTLLVVQEDALPGRGFARAVEKIAMVAPDAVVSLYAGKLLRAIPHLRAAAARCQSLAVLGASEYTPTVAVLIPGHLLDDLAAFGERNAPAGYRHDDEMAAAWARNRGVTVLTTIPCLCEHDNREPSVAGHSNHGVRHAWCLAAPGFDLGSIDWRLP